jgi:uncharacterized protein YqgC (DUF456 family)
MSVIDLWYALLALAVVGGLLLVPLGLPGLWLMLVAAVGYRVVLPQGPIGWATIAVVAALALVAEGLEWWLSARYTRKYGGSRRAGWGALLGGFIGALVGVPVPVIGSVLGGLVGSFVGALVAEYSVTGHGPTAHRAAMGSLVGRVATIVVKTGIGFTIGTILLLRPWFGR